MKHPQLGLILLAATLTSVLAQDLPPPNVDPILKELDVIASGAQNQISARRNSALSQIQAASGSGPSAVAFYLQALDGTKFHDSHTDFMAWQQKNAEFVRSVPFQTASQLQLRYLTLGLQRSDKNDAFAQIPFCLAYLQDLSTETTTHLTQSQKAPKTQNSAAIDKSYEEAANLLKQSLNDSAVVHFLQISDLLPDGKDFAGSAENYEQIMEKNIHVSLRAKNDPRLLGTWDQQMNFEATKATASGSQQQADEFNKTKLPDLLFKKTQDMAVIGQSNRALVSVMEIIHRYPTNPNMRQWVDFARAIASKVVVATPAPAAIPTPLAAGTNPPAPAAPAAPAKP